MSRSSWPRSLPLRGKLVITVLGTVIAVLGVSTYLSFHYWAEQSLATSEQQALLAAGSIRTALESALSLNRVEIAHRRLRELQERAPVTTARVFSPDGVVLLSTDRTEEGKEIPGVWIPTSGELPLSGLARSIEEGDAVRAYLPLHLPDDAVLEVEFSVAPVKAAIERGARLGLGLLVASVLVLAVIVVTMFEREVVVPLQRMDGLLADVSAESAGGSRPDEIQRLEASVNRLIERGRTAEELAQQQHRRLAAQEGLAQVGELAAEMAHEFKRPLASIRTAVDVLQQEYVLDEGGHRVLEAVNSQLERLSDTMSDLFSLARPILLETAPVQAEEVLDDALVALSGYPGAHRVELRRDYQADPPPVAGDRRRLEQAFLNVMVNAVEAMPEGGILSLRVRGLDEDGVEVSFRDTGVGMSPDEIERAFRPFHSTKPVGTGLGLPLVARIVAAHGGSIDVDSTPGVGTTVRMTLPRRPRGGAEPEKGEWPESGSSSWTTTTSSGKSSPSGSGGAATR